MTEVDGLHQKWMRNKEYRKAHEELAPEFALARTVIDARMRADLSQKQLPASAHKAVSTTQARRPTRREAKPAAAPG